MCFERQPVAGNLAWRRPATHSHTGTFELTAGRHCCSTCCICNIRSNDQTELHVLIKGSGSFMVVRSDYILDVAFALFRRRAVGKGGRAEGAAPVAGPT